MGTISYTIPTAGSTLNSIADPEISTALSTLLTLVNGNIDTNNVSPTAGIKYTQLAAPAWQALSLGANVNAGSTYTPSARLEVDVVRLKGSIITTGSVTTIATLPVGLRPSATVGFLLYDASAQIVVPADVTVAGLLQATIPIPSVHVVHLDSITFTLS